MEKRLFIIGVTACLFLVSQTNLAQVTFKYDVLGRVARVLYSDQQFVDYVYDLAGNRSQVRTGILDPSNQPPQINALYASSDYLGSGDQTLITVEYSDVDDRKEDLIVSWRVEGTGAVTWYSDNQVIYRPSLLSSRATEQAVVVVEVFDGHDVTVDRIAVNLARNDSPVIHSVTSSKTHIGFNEPVTLYASVTDPDAGPMPLSYSWQLVGGEGQLLNANEPNPVFVSSNGAIGSDLAIILLSVSDGVGTSTKRVEIVTLGKGAANLPPVVVWSLPDVAFNDLDLVFDARESLDPEDGDLHYTWSFGDGTIVSEPLYVHRYSDIGTYNVRLTVTDARGSSSTLEHLLTIELNPSYFLPAVLNLIDESPNQPPVAIWNYSQPAFNDTDAQFDASQSFDPENGTLSYAWDFGDGNTATSQSPVHKFSQAGVYIVRLSVSDNLGKTGESVQSVSVELNRSHFLPGLLHLLLN